VDLSHALGRKDILLPCARAALAAGADGLMIEFHPTPDQALSDGFQQLDLDAFLALADGLGRSHCGDFRGRLTAVTARRALLLMSESGATPTSSLPSCRGLCLRG